MSRGTVPIQTCDDELGCDQWMVDNYEIGVANWRELLDGWTYDLRDDLAYCPGHQPVTDHDFVGVAGHPDSDDDDATVREWVQGLLVERDQLRATIERLRAWDPCQGGDELTEVHERVCVPWAAHRAAVLTGGRSCDCGRECAECSNERDEVRYGSGCCCGLIGADWDEPDDDDTPNQKVPGGEQ